MSSRLSPKHTLPGATLPTYSLEPTSHFGDEEVTQVSGKLGPDGFVILWMIQLGTCREKFSERSSLVSQVAPSTSWGGGVSKRQEVKEQGFLGR